MWSAKWWPFFLGLNVLAFKCWSRIHGITWQMIPRLLKHFILRSFKISFLLSTCIEQIIQGPLCTGCYITAPHFPIHYNDVKMIAMASQITHVSTVCSVIFLGEDQRKKAPRHWTFWGESTGHRWITLTIGPVTRKMFTFDGHDALNAAISRHNAENVFFKFDWRWFRMVLSTRKLHSKWPAKSRKISWLWVNITCWVEAKQNLISMVWCKTTVYSVR